MEIAGRRTHLDWQKRKQELSATNTAALWERTFDEFLVERISTRYLMPMRAIAKLGLDVGEGFSIVALFCTLLEFLEGCERGLNFDKNANDGDANKYGRYTKVHGGNLFRDFLAREPFKTLLGTHADDFYEAVRCGLLHEARTGKGWKIRTSGPPGVLVEAIGTETVLYRDALEPALNQYLDDYRRRLAGDPALRANFISKWDHLSTP